MGLWKVYVRIRIHDPNSTIVIIIYLTVAHVAVYRPSPRDHDCESALISDNCIPAACRTNRPILSNLAYIMGLHQTRVPGFEGRQTRKPEFEKYPPGLHSLPAAINIVSTIYDLFRRNHWLYAFYRERRAYCALSHRNKGVGLSLSPANISIV